MNQFVDVNKIARKAHEESSRHKLGITQTIRDLHHKNIIEDRERRNSEGFKPSFKKKTTKLDTTKEASSVDNVSSWTTVDNKESCIDKTNGEYPDSNIPAATEYPAPKPIIKNSSIKKQGFTENENKSWDVNATKAVVFDISDGDDSADDCDSTVSKRPTIQFKRRKFK